MDLVSETSQRQLQTSATPGNRRKVFWPVILLSVLVVTATALFFDDVRRLGSLIGLGDLPSKALPRTSRLNARAVDPALSAQLRPVSIPPRLVEIPVLETAGQFLRTWQVTGPKICNALRKAGIETTEWRAASMHSSSYECYFQRVYKRNEVRPLSSTYVKIRGNARGEIFEIRAKILGPKTDAQGRLDPTLMRLFEILVQQAGWNDFHDTLIPIQSLRDVEDQRFGADFRFARDADSENGFNFALVLQANPGAQTRTRAYFSSDRWVAIPEPQMSGVPLPIPPQVR
jgi:hypothetical protein